MWLRGDNERPRLGLARDRGEVFVRKLYRPTGWPEMLSDSRRVAVGIQSGLLDEPTTAIGVTKRMGS